MAKAVGISPSSVRPIWKRHGLQPHRVRSFKLSNDPERSRSAAASAAQVFPLPEAGEALTALLSRRYAGKIVLET
jgi:hypothetical protein